jgi:hypothetical protein
MNDPCPAVVYLIVSPLRALAPACVAVAVLAPSALGATVDRTLRCATEEQGGLQLLQIESNAMTKSHGFWFPSEVTVATGGQTTLLRFLSSNKGLVFDRSRCSDGGGIPLGAAKLPTFGTLAQGDRTWLRARCFVGASVVLRVRLIQDEATRPLRATVAIRTASGTPLAFLRWTRARVSLHAARGCETA